MKKSIVKSVLVLTATFALATGKAGAQVFDLDPFIGPGNIEEQVQMLAEPILGFFGSIGGAGFVNTARVHKLGGFDVGVRFPAAIVPDEFGNLIGDLPDPDVPLGPFDNEDVLGYPFITASLGLPGNLEVNARCFHYPVGERPLREEVTLIGGALKYGLVQNPNRPNIVLLAGYQVLIVPEDFDFGDVSVLSLKGFISQDISMLTFYLGYGYDRTDLTIQIAPIESFLPDGFTAAFDGSSTHTTLGATLNLSVFKINAEYNFGEFQNVTAGATFSIR